MGAIHVIFNPVAGQNHAARLAPFLQSQLDGVDDVRWYATTQPGDARRLAAEALHGGAAAVVAAGGDGTVNEIINGLMSSRDSRPLPPLAIFPIGSANDIASALGIAGIGSSLAHFGNGARRHVDVGQLTDPAGRSRYFCMSAGIGIVAGIAAERNRIRHLRGPALYFLAALRTILKGPAPLQLTISFDGERPEEVSASALLANNSPRSGGFTLAPAADMGDGMLDVLALRERDRPLTTRRLLQLLLAVRAGTHLQHEEIVARRCQALTLNSSQPLLVQLDGELHPMPPGNLHVRLLPGALTVAA